MRWRVGLACRGVAESESGASSPPMSSSARDVYRPTSDNGYYIKISPKGLFGPAEYGEDDQDHGKRKQESGRDGADEIADRDRILQD